MCNPPHHNRFLQSVLSLVLAVAVGYLLGSLPFAYLLVRWRANVDIRTVGSGNVGALNSFEVTRSRAVGFGVLLLDAAKGGAALLAGQAIGGGDFALGEVAGVAAVVGHNFPLWLHFRGGRGLATAAGVLFVLHWWVVAVWGIFWALAFVFLRRVNVANAIALLGTGAAALLLPGRMLQELLPAGHSVPEFRVFVVTLAAVILVKHVQPVRAFVDELQKGRS